MTAPSWTPEAGEDVVLIDNADHTRNDIARVTETGPRTVIVRGLTFRPSNLDGYWQCGHYAIAPTSTPACAEFVARHRVTEAAELLNLEAIRLLNRAHNDRPIDLAPATAALNALRDAATTLTALETR